MPEIFDYVIRITGNFFYIPLISEEITLRKTILRFEVYGNRKFSFEYFQLQGVVFAFPSKFLNLYEKKKTPRQ